MHGSSNSSRTQTQEICSANGAARPPFQLRDRLASSYTSRFRLVPIKAIGGHKSALGWRKDESGTPYTPDC